MDYSLMVGIDDNLQEFNIGIIDYLRPYTFDKIVETVAKFIVRCFTWPTVVPPQHYERRFKEFLSTHLRGHPAWPLRDVEEDEQRQKDVLGENCLPLLILSLILSFSQFLFAFSWLSSWVLSDCSAFFSTMLYRTSNLTFWLH